MNSEEPSDIQLLEPEVRDEGRQEEEEEKVEAAAEEEEEGKDEKEEKEEHDRDRATAASAEATSKKKSPAKSPQPKKASLNSLAFPLARIKRVIKSESDTDTRMTVEAVYAIAKAVGLFLDNFVEESFNHMASDRRYSLTYKDIAANVSKARRFQFLADFVPEKITAASALNNMRADNEE